MKIYIIETWYNYNIIQCGFSSSKTIAEQLAEKMIENSGCKYWVTEYSEDEKPYVIFNS